MIPLKAHYPFTLEPLPYAYDALEPVLDARTLSFHHDKHLQTYVDNLNKALEPLTDLHDRSLEALIAGLDDVPEESRAAVNNNAGGVYNHQLYFRCMGNGGGRPTGALATAIDSAFGSFDQWKEEMKAAALHQFGSGWAWLIADAQGGMHILSTANQNTPLAYDVRPLLLVDVWEHAYYLQYQNRRADYVDNWFSVINWDVVARNYDR